MKNSNLKVMSIVQLVERFTSLALAQFQAEREDEQTKYNESYDEMLAVEQELKGRSKDQRAALVPLFVHPNPQVRLVAAQAALTVAPESARLALVELSERNIYPQAADARGTLMALERGVRRPT